eukprot:gene3979-4607_t
MSKYLSLIFILITIIELVESLSYVDSYFPQGNGQYTSSGNCTITLIVGINDDPALYSVTWDHGDVSFTPSTTSYGYNITLKFNGTIVPLLLTFSDQVNYIAHNFGDVYCQESTLPDPGITLPGQTIGERISMIGIKAKLTDDLEMPYMALCYKYSYDFNPNPANAKFPFGYTVGTAKSYTLDMTMIYSTLVKYLNIETKYIRAVAYRVDQPPGTDYDSVNPVLRKVEILPLGTFTKVIRMSFNDGNSGVYSIKALGYLASEADFSSGNPLEGVLEFIVDLDHIFGSRDSYDIVIKDLAFNEVTYRAPTLLPSLYSVPFIITTQRSLYDITALYFKKQNVDVTNQEVRNTLYLNVTRPDLSMRPQIILTDDKTSPFYNAAERRLSYIVKADPAFEGYQMYDSMPYSIVEVTSNYCDYLGPLLSNVTAIPGTTVDDSNPSNVVGWEFVIEDWPNGFKEGYMVIQSDYNPVPYAINFTAADRVSGDIYRGTYRFTRDLYVSSRIEIYSFTLQLSDQANRITSNVQGTIDSSIVVVKHINPFINIIQSPDTSNQLKITTDTTEPSSDTTAPSLCGFRVLNSSVDVGQLHRSIHVSFNVCDGGSGVHVKNTPTVYINAILNEKVGYPTKIVGELKPSPLANSVITYSCIMNLPYGFGASSHLFFAIHGLFDNHLNINGYSTLTLKDLSYTYNITRLYTHNSHAPISMSGGLLTVYGRKFGLTQGLSSGLSTGQIVGIAIGCIAIVGAMIFATFYTIHKRRLYKKQAKRMEQKLKSLQ